jgi:hypothetical protein
MPTQATLTYSLPENDPIHTIFAGGVRVTISQMEAFSSTLEHQFRQEMGH